MNEKNMKYKLVVQTCLIDKLGTTENECDICIWQDEERHNNTNKIRGNLQKESKEIEWTQITLQPTLRNSENGNGTTQANTTAFEKCHYFFRITESWL